jgi:hypothetical protein
MVAQILHGTAAVELARDAGHDGEPDGCRRRARSLYNFPTGLHGRSEAEVICPRRPGRYGRLSAFCLVPAPRLVVPDQHAALAFVDPDEPGRVHVPDCFRQAEGPVALGATEQDRAWGRSWRHGCVSFLRNAKT